MRLRHKRLTFIVIGLGLLAAAAALILTAIEDSIVFFYSPTQILEGEITTDRRLRVGGLVEEGSVERGQDSTVRFRVTDLMSAVPVQYTGLLPDLFAENQGVVAEGHFRNGTFQADEILAKHDENYMPPEVAEALKASGQWEAIENSLKKSGAFE
ncbi:MAG TPA: cytochrome c maturation protein CcmE [Rhodospirillales bacterium]|jgi:cytochrome c-type biogenesis protein CcmE|nr:cytochrome c maturation protein CcmE [Rhodospirillales bacterium]HJO69672.1 cytochrome c maturation protein CcmE [Rhodospirillales bacterium]|tara:strand:+ start:202 stop:666 length:465 start_codon:yes stop_codon:yes gene_type:complete